MAQITVPGSKSITNRALILAALSPGVTTLRGALWSEDTEAMVDALRVLGFQVQVEPDADEPANRTMRVTGQGGVVPPGGTRERPLELFVGNAGTAARFLAAFVCLGSGFYRLSGVPRMHERPQAALFDALRTLGYRIDSATHRLPVLIEGGGRRPGQVTVSVGESSQFASALLLSAPVGGWEVLVDGGDEEELPYVEMTRQLVKTFPRTGGEFQIEPDASSGSYFWGALEMLRSLPGTDILVRHWPTSGWQIDQQSQPVLENLSERLRGLCVPPVDTSGIPPGYGLTGISRHRNLGDSIMTAIVIAAALSPEKVHFVENNPPKFTDLGRLRLQECERVKALHDELNKCGAGVVEEPGDTLVVSPGHRLHGAVIDTYKDHRMAMCFSILGLKVPGIRIKNPACVKKTFPNFFQKLAAPPPAGLGAKILDATNGRRLSGDELFAE